uniref:Aminotransferase class V domain-containing protein n=2 Tax=Phaeomonas parva TaxID=124430 RepID=A0A6U4FWE9_9STRA|mmetsp:Transcript_27661/g.87705  ORF Transcript_27661/g.87705 Transcript_27661/m.87705 type:complete len:372 (+) Transcript_27661:62-1177(+)
MTMAPPPRLRLDVERDPGLVYLDNAGRTPLPRCVLKAGERALKRKVRPWEGMGNDADVDDVRARYARIIGHDNGADIALCPSTSYSMSLAAHNLVRTGVIARGTEVLVLQNQMASNVMPWQSACRRAGARLRVVPSPSRTWTEAILRDIAQDDARAAPRIAVLALPPLHWTDGALVDLEAIGAAKGGRVLVVDATQAAGAMPLSARRARVDVMAASVHKWLLSPYGMSLVYIHPRFHATWEPLEFHERRRRGSDSATWDEVGAMTRAGYPDAPVPGAARFDAGGRPNPVVVPMVREGLGVVLELRPARVAPALAAWCNVVAHAAAQLGWVSAVRVKDEVRLTLTLNPNPKPKGGLAAELAGAAHPRPAPGP